MFIAALFAIAKIWEQPISTDKWIKKMGYILHDGILLSHKKSENLPSATAWMHLEDIMPSGVSQRKTNTA